MTNTEEMEFFAGTCITIENVISLTNQFKASEHIGTRKKRKEKKSFPLSGEAKYVSNFPSRKQHITFFV